MEMDQDILKLFDHFDPSGAAGFQLFFPKRVRDLLTIIITTSIIPVHPETRLIQEVLASHCRYEPELSKCQKIIVCDHPKLSVSGTRQFKSGKVLQEDMIRYEEYIQRLEALAEKGEAPFKSTRILRCSRYRGFAMAVHEALQVVTTPYVMIIQHDRILSRPFDIQQVLDVMMVNRSTVKYVGLASNKSEGHIPLVSSRYRIDVTPNVMVLEDDPLEPASTFLRRQVSNFETGEKKGRRMLVPLIFWYDSTHIACADHYRTFVFGPHKLNNVDNYAAEFKLGTGDFIEDKLGQAEREDIKANGLSVHKKYGNYLLEDGLGPFVQHCHGRLIGTSSARTFEIYFGESGGA